MSTATKLTYLNETKTLLKNKINLTGANITTDTFRSYPTKLQNALLECWNNEGEPIFTNWGTKVNGEGTNVKLDNTINARMKLTPKGNTTQNGTPTPSSPINVNVVSGDNEVDIVGKNLLNTNFNTTTSNGITFTYNNNKTITIAGTSTASTNIVVGTATLQAGTYIASANMQYAWGKSRIEISGSGSTIALFDTNKSNTITLTEQTTLTFRAVVSGTGTIVDYTIGIMLEKGSTATDYEPYTSQKYPLYLGVENLKDYTTNFTKQAGWSTEFAVSMGQIININIAQASSLVWGVLGYDTSAYNGKQMTLSFDIKTSGDNINVYFDTTSTFAYTTNNANSVPISSEYKRVSFTTNSANNCLYTMIKNTTTNKSASIQIRNVMLSIGGACSYTPYGTTPIELNKIGTYQDYIYKTDKWYLHKEIKKIVFNGTENWKLAERTGTSNGVFYIENYLTTYGVVANTSYSNYSTYYTGYSAQVGRFDIHYGQIRFYAYSSTATIQNWKDMLASNNLIVYSILATPTEEEITNTTLINQLETLKGAMSYEGQTNISSGFMIVSASALGELE